MTILITTQNQDFFKAIHKTLKFTPSTVNTCTFNVTVKTFEKIRNELRAKGINPYSVMNW